MGYRDRRSFDSGPRTMYKAICADCGKECEVPFKPTEGRPVYCRECYAKHRPSRYQKPQQSRALTHDDGFQANFMVLSFIFMLTESNKKLFTKLHSIQARKSGLITRAKEGIESLIRKPLEYE